jgi:hypothetical protein
VAVAALLMAAGAQDKSGTERHVAVYLENSILVPFAVKGEAEALVSEMFAGIGVRLNLHEGRPPASEIGAIIVELVDWTPARFLPGAWAYALPYEGVHIRIFWERMKLEPCPEPILAHVMVHEITHILQGFDRHSAQGIMNARWTDQERLALKRRPLRFTTEDVDLIHRGMNARVARRAGQALAAMQPIVTSISAAH